MKKIKIGIIGADAFNYGMDLISNFKNAELFSVFETNKFRLKYVIASAIENGFYIKAFNNADDFYSSAPDIILIGKDMHEYIRSENSFLLDGFCQEEYAIDNISAEKDGKLYICEKGVWNEFDISSLSANCQLTYIKSGKKPVIAFFIFRQSGSDF